ncbi:hypothetical protein C2E23DRAFT_734858, partial [Lenzites betulinus]
TALLVWHYLITLDKEVSLFWKRGLSGGNILFFANRYITIAVSIYYTLWWPLAPSKPVSSF